MSAFRFRLFPGCLPIAIAAIVIGWGITGDSTMSSGRLTTSAPPRVGHPVPDYGRLPLRFEPNVGQAPASIKFLARGNGYNLALLQDGLILNIRSHGVATLADPGIQSHRAPAPRTWRQLSLIPIHAQINPRLYAEQRRESVSNYFLGNDPAQWRRSIPNYAVVRYGQIYPGIDWVIYGNPWQLEYDFVIAPGADPRQIRLKIGGANRISLAANGDLLLNLDSQPLRQLKPLLYQINADGTRRDVDGHYVLDHEQVAFAVGRYDHSIALIIDPAIVYSTYLGGSSGDGANAIAVDSAGNAYVVGYAGSADFPTVNAYQGSKSGAGSAFVSKFNFYGDALVYSTYLGGSADISGATAIAVDSAGDAYVAGYTYAKDFPTSHAFQASLPGYEAAFVTKFNAAGAALVYSTYLGGAACLFPGFGPGNYSADCGSTQANGIAVDGSGNAYVAGWTFSTDFPTVNAIQSGNVGFHAFVTKLNASGSALVYSTYLGGAGFSGIDNANAIAVDSTGAAYVTGETGSPDFPTVSPIQATKRGERAAFVTKFDPSGSALMYSTYLSGSGVDQGAAIAVDDAGHAYVAGSTSSKDFPTVSPLQRENKSGGTAFVAQLNPAGSALVYSTYLGGSGGESANAIAVDSAGDAYVAGSTTSTDFPLGDSLQSTNYASPNGGSNAFISVFNAAGSALEFSTYLGGSDSVPVSCPQPLLAGVPDSAVCYGAGDSASGIALDDSGSIYIAGSADSSDFPTSQSFQSLNNAAANGAPNAFVAKISTQPVTAAGGGGALGWGSIGVLALLLAAQLGYRGRS
jgi:hypothetical protein